MNKAIDFIHLLAEYNPVPFPVIKGAFRYEDRTPSHYFVTYVMPLFDSTYCVALPVRDYSDDHLAYAVLNFIHIRSREEAAKHPLTTLDKFQYSPYGFNMIALLSPTAANQFEHVHSRLNRRSFVAFPTYNCELSGNESAKELNEIRHGLLDSLNWKRTPCPKVLMSFHFEKPAMKSRSSEPKLATMEMALRELETKDSATVGWIRLINYLGLNCEIRLLGARCSVQIQNQNQIVCAKSEARTLISKFLMD